MKVFQNSCTIELNSQRIARYASVPILRGMEALKINAIFMNVSATLICNLAVYGTAAKHIVKRGGCAVLLECIKYNWKQPGVLGKLIRCISNLLLTDSKSYEKFMGLDAEEVVNRIRLQYPNHKQISKCSDAFL